MKTEEKLWDDIDKWRIWFLHDPHKSWNIKGIWQKE